MCQPFGKVLGFPDRYSFTLRSSPIICAGDSLRTILEVFYHTIRKRSLVKAASLTVSARFADTRADGDGSFAALRKNTVFRVLLFVLGALPQLVKLYASRGTLWLQVLVTLYLASFTISEIIAALAPRDQVERAPAIRINIIDDTHLYKDLITEILLGFSIAFAYVFFAASIFVMIQQYWHLAAWPLILSACLLNILFVCSIVSSRRELLILCSGPLVGLSGASLTFATLPLIAVSASFEFTNMILPENRRFVALLATVVILASITSSVSFYRLTRNISAKYASYMLFELSAYYFLLHLITAFLAFCFLFDSGSTTKPAWTDALGR
jgi:hypothetical protein